MENQFLPTNKAEMTQMGMEQADFVLITGDAYVDHPSFGTSLIGRYLESFGYRIAILSQPDWKDTTSLDKCGRPALGFLVSSGNMDSMVNHYYVSKKRRTKDLYTVDGHPGRRPDDAVITYCRLIRQVYGDIPIIIGGIEASLRRFTHYDYIKNSLRPSILTESGADLLVYSMGERAIIEIADYLKNGVSIKDINFIPGTALITANPEMWPDHLLLDSYEVVCKDKRAWSQSFLIQYQNNEAQSARVLAEPYQDKYVIQNIPQPVLDRAELDHLYDLPFTYESYDEYHHLGKVAALDEVKFSISLNRGCNGGCNFCAITFHQGKQVSMRSQASAVKEARMMTSLSDFKGYIHDVGGPTANFNDNMCKKLNKKGSCPDKECFTPDLCPNLKVDHTEYFDTLKAIREIESIKKVFIRSGIRYDYLQKDKNPRFIPELIEHHVSGMLRLAPEHSSPHVLELMNKPPIESYLRFVKTFYDTTRKLKLDQYAAPYFISSHPGSTLKDALDLAIFIKEIDFRPTQVQDFYPTPGTMSTAMYYTGIHPKTGQRVYVERNEHQKAMQRALLQVHLPANYHLVYDALKELGRLDLVSFKADALLHPRKRETAPVYSRSSSKPVSGKGKKFPPKNKLGKNPTTRKR